MVDEVDWDTILNPKAYFAEAKKDYSKAIQKHKAAAKSAYNAYQRTDKRSYYDKYQSEKYDYVEKYEKKTAENQHFVLT